MLDEYNLRYVDAGRIIRLTYHETRILAQLIKDKRRRWSNYDSLADAIGYIGCDKCVENCIKNHITGLRNKLHKFIVIENKIAVGYRVKYIA